jgi:transposase
VSLVGRQRARGGQQIEYAADPRNLAAHTKKKTRYATERNTEEVQEQRRVYQTKVSTLEAKDLVFVDETGVNIAMARPYARAPKGQRIYAAVPVNTGKNLTVLAALSLVGIVEAMTIAGSSDGQVFSTFIQEVCVPVLRPGQTVIMDNLSSHKVEGIQEAIEAVGARLEYLPPYSPDLSPIEECWSKLKTILRAKAARTSAHLDQAITEAFDLITPQDARGWFAHCGYV